MNVTVLIKNLRHYALTDAPVPPRHLLDAAETLERVQRYCQLTSSPVDTYNDALADVLHVLNAPSENTNGP